MNIQMTGIDHEIAPLLVREKYALTKTKAIEVLSRICGITGGGVTAILTCNRTEFWFCPEDGHSIDMTAVLADVFDDPSACRLFVMRNGEDAAKHLFETACGMKSAVFGEVQILSQVKSAILLAREAKTSNAVLESLFNRAVAAAKKVVTNVRLAKADTSLASACVDVIKKRFESFSSLDDVQCLIVGNGEMGRLTAELLVKEGMSPVMTQRTFKNGEAVIPFGCRVIPYEKRYEALSGADAVISATTSPHLTMIKADAGEFLTGRTRLFIDLAVPRDIDGAFEEDGAREVINIDDLKEEASALADVSGRAADIGKAKEILDEELNDFFSWYVFRSLVPAIREISEMTARDVCRRLTIKPDADGSDIYDAVSVSVGRLLFGMKENVERELWEKCYEGIHQSARTKEG